MVTLFGAEMVRKGAFKYGESFICSYEKKTTDLKEICMTLRTNMIKSLSANRSKKRFSEKEILSIEQEFSESAYDLLKKLLDLDCEKRLSAENALKHPFFK